MLRRELDDAAVVHSHSHGGGMKVCRGGRSAVAVSPVQQGREGGSGQRDLDVVWQSGGRARVADGYLPRDGRAVFEAGGDVVREVGVDGGEDADVGRDGADHGEEVNGGLKGAGEDAGAGQEHVADGGFGKVEGGRWPGSLDDLEVQGVEDGPDEFSLGRRDVGPEEVAGFDDVEPFYTGF